MEEFTKEKVAEGGWGEEVFEERGTYARFEHMEERNYAVPLFKPGSDEPLIHPNPDQPRNKFHKAGMHRLSSTVKKVGQIEPIKLVPFMTPEGKFEFAILDGERRWRSALAKGHTHIKATICWAKTNDSLFLQSFAANLGREDHNPIEYAEAILHCMDILSEEYGIPRRLTGKLKERVAEDMGITLYKINRYLKFLDLDPAVRELLAMGKIKEGHANKIAAIHKAKMTELRKRFGVASVEDLDPEYQITQTDLAFTVLGITSIDEIEGLPKATMGCVSNARLIVAAKSLLGEVEMDETPIKAEGMASQTMAAIAAINKILDKLKDASPEEIGYVLDFLINRPGTPLARLLARSEKAEGLLAEFNQMLRAFHEIPALPKVDGRTDFFGYVVECEDALSDRTDTRFRMVQELAKASDEKTATTISAQEIADALGVALGTVTGHLKSLEDDLAPLDLHLQTIPREKPRAGGRLGETNTYRLIWKEHKEGFARGAEDGDEEAEKVSTLRLLPSDIEATYGECLFEESALPDPNSTPNSFDNPGLGYFLAHIAPGDRFRKGDFTSGLTLPRDARKPPTNGALMQRGKFFLQTMETAFPGLIGDNGKLKYARLYHLEESQLGMVQLADPMRAVVRAMHKKDPHSKRKLDKWILPASITVWGEEIRMDRVRIANLLDGAPVSLGVVGIEEEKDDDGAGDGGGGGASAASDPPVAPVEAPVVAAPPTAPEPEPAAPELEPVASAPKPVAEAEDLAPIPEEPPATSSASVDALLEEAAVVTGAFDAAADEHEPGDLEPVPAEEPAAEEEDRDWGGEAETHLTTLMNGEIEPDVFSTTCDKLRTALGHMEQADRDQLAEDWDLDPSGDMIEVEVEGEEDRTIAYDFDEHELLVLTQGELTAREAEGRAAGASADLRDLLVARTTPLDASLAPLLESLNGALSDMEDPEFAAWREAGPGIPDEQFEVMVGDDVFHVSFDAEAQAFTALTQAQVDAEREARIRTEQVTRAVAIYQALTKGGTLAEFTPQMEGLNTLLEEMGEEGRRDWKREAGFDGAAREVNLGMPDGAAITAYRLEFADRLHTFTLVSLADEQRQNEQKAITAAKASFTREAKNFEPEESCPRLALYQRRVIDPLQEALTVIPPEQWDALFEEIEFPTEPTEVELDEDDYLVTLDRSTGTFTLEPMTAVRLAQNLAAAATAFTALKPAEGRIDGDTYLEQLEALNIALGKVPAKARDTWASEAGLGTTQEVIVDDEGSEEPYVLSYDLERHVFGMVPKSEYTEPYPEAGFLEDEFTQYCRGQSIEGMDRTALKSILLAGPKGHTTQPFGTGDFNCKQLAQRSPLITQRGRTFVADPSYVARFMPWTADQGLEIANDLDQNHAIHKFDVAPLARLSPSSIRRDPSLMPFMHRPVKLFDVAFSKPADYRLPARAGKNDRRPQSHQDYDQILKTSFGLPDVRVIKDDETLVIVADKNGRCVFRRVKNLQPDDLIPWPAN